MGNGLGVADQEIYGAGIEPTDEQLECFFGLATFVKVDKCENKVRPILAVGECLILLVQIFLNAFNDNLRNVQSDVCRRLDR